MKTFSVAVAVAVVLTFICIQESSAVPVTEVEKLPFNAIPGNAPWLIPEEYKPKKKESACRLCCGCCEMSGCGVCCRF
ncbi:hepcidin-like [Scomber scombrus]|uniref:hepcidin-like n=1 Tax=Scomber scombrus TaxID=13677 RepID=UPI002DD8E49D|nr:hepcidin-like [Scomber scombrus]